MSKNRFVLFAILCFVVFGTLTYRRLPSHLTESTAVEQRLILLDRNNREIRSYSSGETYDWAPLAEVPAEFQKFILLAEDKDFYQHHGVDYRSMLRSLWLNLKALSVVSGASTISQQAYRLSFSISRTPWGKFKTTLGALKLETNYGKAKILEHYLNALPFGKRVVGVKRASEVLIGKELSLLSLADMATLAVLPRSPSLLLHPKHHERLKQKRNDLIRKYAKVHGLDKEQLEIELKSPVLFKMDHSGWANYHFGQLVMRLENLDQFVDRGSVHTTLDLNLQREVTEILRSKLSELRHFKVNHGAVFVLDNISGDVLAYVGNRGERDEEGNYFDALQVKRQPGSALKPLTYALALQKGWSLNQVLPDIPSFYKTGLGQFLPRNYDHNFSGPRLMREALANSLNLPAVALADSVGVHELWGFFREMGLTLEHPFQHYGVGLTLGNVEITPFELGQVYSAFATGGQRTQAKFFVKQLPHKYGTPLKKETAFLISDVLNDRVARREEFGENNPFDLPFALSVKTGTSTDFRDNWAVGYNSRHTIVVWVGNMDQSPMKRVSGITGAGPVLARVAKYLFKNKFVPQLEVPSGVHKITICSLSGKTPGPHCKHRKEEFMRVFDAIPGTCDFHHALLVRSCHAIDDQEKVAVSVLPDMYQAFVKERPHWSIKEQVAQVCENENHDIEMNPGALGRQVMISRPLANSIFAIDPHIPRSLQKLKLELNRFHGVKSVEWKRNGSVLLESGASLDWPMEKGKHSFEANVEFDDGRSERSPSLEVTVL